MEKIKSYPVCPYYSAQNNKITIADGGAKIIKCACKTARTNSVSLGFRSAQDKRGHMAEFCLNLGGYEKCRLFKAIFAMEGVTYGD